MTKPRAERCVLRHLDKQPLLERYVTFFMVSTTGKMSRTGSKRSRESVGNGYGGAVLTAAPVTFRASRGRPHRIRLEKRGSLNDERSAATTRAVAERTTTLVLRRPADRTEPDLPRPRARQGHGGHSQAVRQRQFDGKEAC